MLNRYVPTPSSCQNCQVNRNENSFDDISENTSRTNMLLHFGNKNYETETETVDIYRQYIHASCTRSEEDLKN